MTVSISQEGIPGVSNSHPMSPKTTTGIAIARMIFGFFIRKLKPFLPSKTSFTHYDIK
jgi:hypothetical protein